MQPRLYQQSAMKAVNEVNTFFFSSRRRHTRSDRDWSSDVCSSDLIAIEQKTTTRSPRSTVGTITEIYDYLRVVYSSVGLPHCPSCGRPITRQTSEQIVQAILNGELCKASDRIMILAPIARGRKGAYRKELEK